MGRNALALIALWMLVTFVALGIACGGEENSRRPPSSTQASVPVSTRQPQVAMTAPSGRPQPTMIAARNVPPVRLSPPNDEPYWATYFENYGVNPFIATEDLRFSTFSVDVDTASYTVTRSYLQNGQEPPKDAVRVEEFINYFDNDYPAPAGTFGLHLDGAKSRFGEDNKHLLRIGIRGRDVFPEERPGVVLTFVVDVSGSMDIDARIGLAKRSLERLVDGLGRRDKVGVVIYGSTARKLLEPTSDKSKVRQVVRSLHAEGATNAEAGLRLGYEMATTAFEDGKINRVVLISDGVANVGVTGPEAILEKVREYADQRITLTTIGVGMENYNDVLMEQLADRGDGNYYYIDTDAEARALFGSTLMSVLQVIAADVKVQVEFNPDVVDRYRLIGYENRALETEDFRDDTVDAGEVGAGHVVTALYELRIKDDAAGKVANVRLRYLNPETRTPSEMSASIGVLDLDRPFDSASPRFRFLAAVAEFGELLKESFWAQGSDLESVRQVASRATRDMEGNASDQEFVELVRIAGTLRR